MSDDMHLPLVSGDVKGLATDGGFLAVDVVGEVVVAVFEALAASTASSMRRARKFRRFLGRWMPGDGECVEVLAQMFPF